MDLTQRMNSFRECARGLWNIYMRADYAQLNHDGPELFGVLRERLLHTLVLFPAGLELSERPLSVRPVQAIDALRLQAKLDPLPVMIQRPSKEGAYWDDPTTTLRRNSFALAYIDTFDWDQFGHLDLRYYRASLISCTDHPELIGREVLVDTSHVEVTIAEGPEAS
jgi:hypothetical protein